MKIWSSILLLTANYVIQAQEFKPYKVKSGKISYEKLKYSTHSGFLIKNGVKTSYNKQVPYVAEQVIYYWDEFGDIAFEEIYQVSKFGGKLLPEKVKIAERLWIDEHRYYFNFEENKVYDDPYYLRIKCREHFQYYQIKDSWIETLHMGTEKSGTQEILDKQADYYKIDKYQDLYAWKGLVLKSESFYTTPKGERLHLNRAKIAIEIDTVSVVNKALFNPIWLKRFYNNSDEYPDSFDSDEMSESDMKRLRNMSFEKWKSLVQKKDKEMRKASDEELRQIYETIQFLVRKTN